MSNPANMSKSRLLDIICFQENLFAIKFMPVLVVYIFCLILKQMLSLVLIRAVLNCDNIPQPQYRIPIEAQKARAEREETRGKGWGKKGEGEKIRIKETLGQ